MFNPGTFPYFKFYVPVFDAAARQLGVKVVAPPVLTGPDALTEFAREPNGGV